MAAKQRVPRLAVTGVRATGLALGMVWAMGCRAGGFTAAATLDGVSNLKGGVDQKSVLLGTAYLGYGHQFEHGEFAVTLQGTAGGSPSTWAGDAQGVNNTEADDTGTLYELWYQHNFAEGSVQVLVGINDFNASFATLDAAGLLINASFGIGPDVAQAASSIFPVTTFGGMGRFNWNDQYLQMAVYDGVAGDPNNPHGFHLKHNPEEGYFTAAEWGLETQEGANKFALGLWQHSADAENLTTAEAESSNSGIYALGQRQLNDNWRAFVQLGLANKKISEVTQYVGAGITRSQVWHAEDAIGLAFAHAQANKALNTTANAETAIEITYLRPLGAGFSVQPDVQYVLNPGFERDLDNAWVLTVRLSYELPEM